MERACNNRNSDVCVCVCLYAWGGYNHKMSCSARCTIRTAGRRTKNTEHCFQTAFLTHIHVYVCVWKRGKERGGEGSLQEEGIKQWKGEEMESIDENMCGWCGCRVGVHWRRKTGTEGDDEVWGNYGLPVVLFSLNGELWFLLFS